MSDELPSSSWHPALRPESAADLPAPDTIDATHAVNHDSAQPEQKPASPSNLDFGATPPAEEDDGAAWFADEASGDVAADVDDDDVDQWLQSDDVVDVPQNIEQTEEPTQSDAVEINTEDLTPSPNDAAEASPLELADVDEVADVADITDVPVAEDTTPAAADDTELANNTEREPNEPELPKQKQGTTSQHSSSMSFARTVSHEISFNSDDDDWNLSRTDTDPFKFMPPSDRTNSFPVVPPSANAPQGEPEHSLPASQALDILEETERDAPLADDFSGEHQHGHTAEEQPSDDVDALLETNNQLIGGELHNNEAEAAEARFEEGIPLLPADQNDATEAAPKDTGSFAAAFGDDDGDDFFSQQQHDVDSAPAESIQPVERKSTMQVIAAASPEINHAAPVEEQQQASKSLDAFGASTDVADADFFDNVTEAKPDTQEAQAPTQEDLDAKWKAAFGGDEDDDDFLLDDQAGAANNFDAAGFLGSDDEGLLEDDDDDLAAPAQVSQSSTGAQSAAPVAPTNRYAPASQNYTPAQLPASVSAPSLNYGVTGPPATFNQLGIHGQTLPTPPADQPSHKAASFAAKSTAGYSSPYDLPTDLITSNVRPRKQASMQHLSRNDGSAAQSAAPPRSASMNVPSPTATYSQPPAQSTPPAAAARPKANFFEELPMTSKPRPASRHSNRAPSPAQPPPPSNLATQNFAAPPTSTLAGVPPPAQTGAPLPGSDIPNLVAPAKVNPYAALPSAAQTPPFAGNANRYSPAPAQQPGQSSSAPPPASANRYSPAPTQTRQTSSQSPPMPAGPPQMHHTHLPRTSSPLAHFEISNDKSAGDSAHADRRANSAYEPRLNRVSSLPPTTEVEEEEDEQGPGTRSVSASHPPNAASLQARYSPMPYDAKAPSVSPSKKTAGYAPSAAAQQSQLPPRSQTQSPGAMRGKAHASFVQDGRPSTSHANTSNVVKASSQTAYASAGRARGPSLTMGLVPPTDGSEHDPLNRWQGAPVITWGVGGTMVTSFPKSVSRYAMGQAAPTTLRTSGEVKFLNIKDMEPLPERLTKFPGPIKGKSKKKEVLAWLGAGIDTLAKDLPDVSLHQHLSLEAKRSIERLLLWKLLRVFVEHDGHLEGNAAVDQAVRGILSPTSAPVNAEASFLSAQPSFNAVPTSAVTSMQADSIDSGSIAELRNNLLTGDREKAVWAAVDKRLWGHAMLIAHTVSPELYQHVAQEFVRKEVNFTGHNNESLGAFYKIISGNFDDCVDELVPSHARAGFQLMSTQASTGTTADVTDGLDKWQETLSLVLSNRSPDDVRGLKALGQLLSSYGRAEAAQICFIFSRAVSVFGGADAPDVDFVLVGSDHRSQSDQFAKEVEALQLSEIYEYGLSLGGGPLATAGAPHLAAYKLQHAVVLAEYGMRDKALQYCDAISAAISAQTKRSPYYHPVLEMSVDDFMRRLKQAPKEEGGGSWMSKPSMGKVSDSMWNRFNKFVAGDENGPNGAGASGESESGPFARIASTPNISRSPSVNNFEMYGGASPNYSTNIVPPSGPAVPSAAGSRYAPATTPAAAAGLNPYEHLQQPVSAPPIAQPSNSYAPTSYEPSPAINQPVNAGYSGAPAETSYGYQPQSYEPNGTQPAAVAENNSYQPSGYQPQGVEDPSSFNPYSAPQPDIQGFQPSTFDPPAMNTTSFEPQNDESQEQTAGGYEPPSFQPYGYEPPSYQPPSNDDEDEDAPKPKKKSFMDDDDDDDIPALRAPSQAPQPPQSAPPQAGGQKTRAEIDRENAELVKKIAEEEEKRAAEQQAQKKGWGFGGWFGGSKKAAADPGEPAKKAIRAKLGEANSFVYDPELKRWINKAAGAEQTEAPKAAPPPPRAAPRSVSGTPPPMAGTPPPGARSASNPMDGSLAAPPVLGGAPPMGRQGSSAGASATGPPTGPPSRPTTSMSNASSIDDLLGAPAPRKGGKKPRKSGRYVDVMAK